MKNNWNSCFYLDQWARIQPQKTAVITESAEITYEKLQKISWQFSQMLKKSQLHANDSVLIFMPNCIEYTITFFAASRLYLNITLANALYKDSELKFLVETIQPQMAFVLNDTQESMLHSVAPDLNILQVPKILRQLENESTLYEAAFTDVSPALMEKARICISTSGSTGTPKVVSNSYDSEIINASLYVEKMLVNEEDILMTALPATQRFGMAALLGSCMKGSTLVMLSKFHAPTVLSLIEKHQVTVQYGVPTMYLKEITAFETAENPPCLSSLRTGVIAGSNCSEKLFRWFEDHAGCRLLNCYGTSEIGGLTMVSYDAPEEIRYHTCGQVLRDAVIKITDRKGNILPTGETGEVICYVPWVMKGYIGEPGLTAQMFDENGYFLTGDIGHLDENGSLIINGRKKDLIIRGGYNIFPAELEQVLLSLPEVQETCVMGCKDALLGERIVAFVKLTDETVSPQQIRQSASHHIAKYKLPDQIIPLKSIPKLPNGKIDCPALKAIFKKEKISG